MSAAKHTPGPWAVEDPMDFELTIVEAGKPTHEWRFIASCTLPDPDEERHDLPRNEVEANAHLIAAAPELYEALDELRLLTQKASLSNNDHPWVQGAFAKTDAALAKARGEA